MIIDADDYGNRKPITVKELIAYLERLQEDEKVYTSWEGKIIQVSIDDLDG